MTTQRKSELQKGNNDGKEGKGKSNARKDYSKEGKMAGKEEK